MKLLGILAISITAFTFTGCVSTLDGHKEGGVPFVKDKLVRVYERPVLQVWAAAKDVLTKQGNIFGEDVMQSTLAARVDTRTVRVKVESLDSKNTRMSVQCRKKTGGADLDLAGEIDKLIALRLATGTSSPSSGPGAK